MSSAALFSLCLLLDGAAAPSTAQPALARARAAYDDGALDTALGELLTAEPAAAGPRELATIKLAEGIVLASLPNLDAGRLKWEEALALWPEATLPWPAAPKVQAEFERLLQSARRLRPEPPPEPPPLAPSAAPPAAAPRPRWAIPGVAAGLAAVGLGLGLGFGAASKATLGQLEASPWEDERDRFYLRAGTEALAANLAFAAAGALALAAAISLLVVALR